jgi:hypothetical protein
MEMRVMALEDVFVTKLMALSEHALRFEGVLQMAPLRSAGHEAG